jgi:GT2 family glycosyltransferase
MKVCYIVILNYKRWDETLGCIRSVFTSTYPAFRVIVIDNDSGNGSLERLAEDLGRRPIRFGRADSPVVPAVMDAAAFSTADLGKLPEITLVQNLRNAGFAGGNNVALRRLLFEDAYIWLLNPDMTVVGNTLSEMIRMAELGPDAVIGSVHYSFTQPERIIQLGGARVNYWSGNASFIRKAKDTGRLGYISGGSLLADAAVYRAVGVLPEDYFLYWEETDWCYRARQKGFRMVVCQEAITYDKRSTTIGSGFLADYFYTRNGLLFLKKYKRQFLPTAFLMAFFRIAKKLVLGQGARARGVAQGTLDFLTGRRYENK